MNRPYPMVTRDFLKKFYQKDKISISQIAKMVGCSWDFVRRRIGEEKLAAKTLATPRNLQHNMAKKQRIQKNKCFALYENDARTIRRSIQYGKQQGRVWKSLPYTLEDLCNHLETLFEPEMTWKNRGRYGWHLDHILPRSLCQYESYGGKNFLQCWGLKNLRPCWYMPNIRRGNKL